MNPPDVVRWVSRNGEDGDCAIAAIALATGASYEEALAAAVKVQEAAVTHGMVWRDIKATVRRLGFSCQAKRKYNIRSDSGILDCKAGRREHVVYLWAGRIIEPMLQRRTLHLDPEAYLKGEGWTAGMLLTLKKD